MQVILLVLITFIGYIIAYRTYGRFVARKIFELDDFENMPSVQYRDGKDYVPTKRAIIFGHHYTSIAATGPIVGPAIGVIWGWLPAILWIFFGSIFMGAVHDFGALVLSLRNQGKSISDITEKYISKRAKFMFFTIIFFALLIVIAIFGLVIAVIFSMFPESVFPVWAQIPIAVILGICIYKKGFNVVKSTIVAVFLMYITVMLGQYIPFKMPTLFGIPSTGVWTIILLTYAFIASTLPVTTLLQPRDYINAWQLFVAMFILISGIFFAGFFMDIKLCAPAINLHPAGTPPIWPFLFINIACGAISGFHALVASGTSSKQIEKPSDALFVGYGSMLLESALAVIVIIAVTAGICMAYKSADGSTLTGISAWNAHYSSWQASHGLGSKINAVVIGSANLIGVLGIQKTLGIAIMGVFIASFAGTTLDSATRIQRYVVSEIFSDLNVKFMTNKFTATAFAVLTAFLLAFATGADGKGALKLWPMFGAVNQLLASLALTVLTVYLRKRGGLKFLVTGIPCILMLIMTIWSVTYNEINFITNQMWLLAIVNGVVTLLACWMLFESFNRICAEFPATKLRG